jgi:hypothetical protein
LENEPALPPPKNDATEDVATTLNAESAEEGKASIKDTSGSSDKSSGGGVIIGIVIGVLLICGCIVIYAKKIRNDKLVHVQSIVGE